MAPSDALAPVAWAGEASVASAYAGGRGLRGQSLRSKRTPGRSAGWWTLRRSRLLQPPPAWTS